MSFWKTSDGKDTRETGTEFEMGGGSMEPIPEGTTVLAAATDVKYAGKDGDIPHIEITHTILAPDAYKGRKVWQKIHVEHTDSKKRDKARRMLAAIDANCGGHLAKTESEPTDASMASALLNKPMQLKLGVWSMNDKTGNWVMAVAPKGTPAAAAAPKAAPKPASGPDASLGF